MLPILRHLALLLVAAGPAPGEWRHYGGDPGGGRFSRLAQINRGNVARLGRAWTYHTGEQTRTAFEATPLVVAGVLYFTTPASRVIALEAETGKELWQFDPHPAAGAASRRTAASPTGRTGGRSRIIYGTGAAGSSRSTRGRVSRAPASAPAGGSTCARAWPTRGPTTTR